MSVNKLIGFNLYVIIIYLNIMVCLANCFLKIKHRDVRLSPAKKSKTSPIKDKIQILKGLKECFPKGVTEPIALNDKVVNFFEISGDLKKLNREFVFKKFLSVVCVALAVGIVVGCFFAVNAVVPGTLVCAIVWLLATLFGACTAGQFFAIGLGNYEESVKKKALHNAVKREIIHINHLLSQEKCSQYRTALTKKIEESQACQKSVKTHKEVLANLIHIENALYPMV